MTILSTPLESFPTPLGGTIRETGWRAGTSSSHASINPQDPNFFVESLKGGSGGGQRGFPTSCIVRMNPALSRILLGHDGIPIKSPRGNAGADIGVANRAVRTHKALHHMAWKATCHRVEEAAEFG